ncbi:MAG TPA: hypothetical protein VLA19_25650, partial [Herpetosiphonaceae bacterium]|nr:hypothetical protein [Herpetosiphonaceae bacterium]
HARPDVDVPGAETPELPPEVFPNPEPNQPPHPSPEHDQAVPDWPSTGDESPTPKPKAQHPRPVPVPPGPPEPEPVPTPDPSPVPTPPLVQRVVVRVPEPAPLGGLVGWLATGPMLGPVPVWALLLLAFGALLVQLGLLG